MCASVPYNCMTPAPVDHDERRARLTEVLLAVVSESGSRARASARSPRARASRSAPSSTTSRPRTRCCGTPTGTSGRTSATRAEERAERGDVGQGRDPRGDARAAPARRAPHGRAARRSRSPRARSPRRRWPRSCAATCANCRTRSPPRSPRPACPSRRARRCSRSRSPAAWPSRCCSGRDRRGGRRRARCLPRPRAVTSAVKATGCVRARARRATGCRGRPSSGTAASVARASRRPRPVQRA